MYGHVRGPVNLSQNYLFYLPLPDYVNAVIVLYFGVLRTNYFIIHVFRPKTYVISKDTGSGIFVIANGLNITVFGPIGPRHRSFLKYPEILHALYKALWKGTN